MTFFVRRFADDSIWLAQKSIDFSCDSALCTNNNNERRIRTNRQFSFSFFARSMRYARYALCARAPNLCVQLLFDIFLAEVFARFKFVCLCVINSIYYSVEENAQIHLPRHSATLPNCECCRALEFGTVMWPSTLCANAAWGKVTVAVESKSISLLSVICIWNRTALGTRNGNSDPNWACCIR